MQEVSYRRLQQYALAISIASIIYNGAEGGVSIGLGADADSRSLIFFGIQSGIEVISSILVVWRFRKIAKPGEERGRKLDAKELKIEKTASTCIAYLLILLGLATVATSIYGLVKHSEPTTSTASLAVSASALFLMIIIWLPKRYLARALNSSAMQAEAQCSLSCIQITIVLFVGALIFKVWRGGWWVDSATSIVLGLAFGWEGIKLLRWVRNPNFDGGCCAHCHDDDMDAKVELGLEERYRDLCECCNEKEECKNSDDCQCSTSESVSSEGCCVPMNGEGKKCCSHAYVAKPKNSGGADSCCEKSANPGICASHPADGGSNGCCKTDGRTKDAQRGVALENRYRDATCECCAEKDECKSTPEDPVTAPQPAKARCVPSNGKDSKCSATLPKSETKNRVDTCCGTGDCTVKASPQPPVASSSKPESDKASECSCCD